MLVFEFKAKGTVEYKTSGWNAAINILKLALSTAGHVGTWILNPNALGDSTSTLIGEILSRQAESLNKESPHL